MERIARTSTLALALFSLTATGCNEGDAAPTTDKVSARNGWHSTEQALGQAGIQTGWSGGGMVGPDGVTGAVMGTVECPDGGSMEVDAAGEVTDDLVSGGVVIDFYGCSADGVTIDGTLEYSGRVTEDEVVASINGDLEWSGEADGQCSIDLEASVSAAGVSVGGSAVGGEMCGYGWDEVFE